MSDRKYFVKKSSIDDVTEREVVDNIGRLKASKDENECFDALKALASIARMSGHLRDYIISKGVMRVVKKTFQSFSKNKELIGHIAGFFSTICKHKSTSYPVKAIMDILPVIKEIMFQHTDIAIHVDLTLALAYAIDNYQGFIDVIISQNFLPMINSNFCRSNEIVMPSLHVMGNIVAGNDFQTSEAINSGVIESMDHLLSSDDATIVEESCWVLSSISAGTEDQVMTLIESNVILRVLNVLEHGNDKSKKEALGVISNIIKCKKDIPKKYLLRNNIFKYLISLLRCDDTELVMLSLKSIVGLIKRTRTLKEQEHRLCCLDNLGGINIIFGLQNHKSDEVSKMSVEFLNEFYMDNEDE